MTLSNRPAEQEKQAYQLGFSREAQKEWKKLGKPIQLQFALNLQERLKNPHVAKDALSAMPHCYKIKLHSIGFRLVYQVIDKTLVVTVITVGKRERNEVYRKAQDRF